MGLQLIKQLTGGIDELSEEAGRGIEDSVTAKRRPIVETTGRESDILEGRIVWRVARRICAAGLSTSNNRILTARITSSREHVGRRERR